MINLNEIFIRKLDWFYSEMQELISRAINQARKMQKMLNKQ